MVPTLNLGDNTGDTRATVLILIEEGNPVIMRNREGCAGGARGRCLARGVLPWQQATIK